MASMQSKGTKLAIGILVVGVLFAFLLPVAIDPIAGDRTQNITHTEDTTVALTGIIDVNATDINNTSSPNEVTVVLTNTDTGNSVTASNVDVGTNTTVSLAGEDIKVAPQSVSDSTTATVEYTYSETTGWGDAEKAIYGLLPVFIILAGLLYVVRKTT